MSVANYEYEKFYTRSGFNDSLGHFQSTVSMVEEVGGGLNLADALNEALTEGAVEQNQISPIVYALLVDKFDYVFHSFNMNKTLDGFEVLAKVFSGWKALDIVITYMHPELGWCIINPKSINQWKSIQILKKNEIVNVYVGAMGKKYDGALAKKCLNLTQVLIETGKAKVLPALLKGSFGFKPKPVPKKVAPRPAKKKPGRKPAASVPAAKTAAPVESAPEPEAKQEPAVSPGGKKRMTPLYSVPVTNELFHNGNVEAWKRIIHSYTTKHPGLEVYIFYDGERIHDINALFKWGKVKHGSSILFAVAGDEIKDVAKLQRYLKQGASHRFEDFLRFPVNTVLNLF